MVKPEIITKKPRQYNLFVGEKSGSWKGGDQCLFLDYEEVPFFCGPEETREFNRLFSKNESFIYSSLLDEFRKEVNETVHLDAASYCAAKTLVSLASLLLFSPLSRPGFPVMGHSPRRSLGQFMEDLGPFHFGGSIADSALYSKGQLMGNFTARPRVRLM